MNTTWRWVSAVVGSFVVTSLVASLPLAAAQPAAGGGSGDADHGKSAWERVAGKPADTRNGHAPAIKPKKMSAYKLNRGQMESLLAAAPRERGKSARLDGLLIRLPSPSGEFQLFSLEDSPIMEPGLAAKHPEIKTYRGRGVDDAAATIRADMTPLGFHASIRSSLGSWYIDPYYHLDDSLYASYFGRDLTDDSREPFVERDADAAELSVDKGHYHAPDTVTLHGSGFAANAAISVTISDPQERFTMRTESASSNEQGSFDLELVADPDGNLDTHIVEASDGSASAWASYQVVRDDDPSIDPPTGDLLRTYRLALITDPSYADFHGGSANVTAAKVTLMNRIDQVYEDDLSIRLMLVANNDLLNLDTWAQAIGPNGPCGTAACFTLAQTTGCNSITRARIVIGQLIGASSYDIGHLLLGQPGGGIANLGVVGRSNKAGGCTGIPTPVGDFLALDYVAHELGHQFSGNHTFNGNQANCSGGNRNSATSVEPASGSSIMSYAGICLADDLQPHNDPYFSQRSLQEISSYTSFAQGGISEVQTVSLRHFGGGNEVQVVTFGPGYGTSVAIQPLSVAINAAPSAASLGGVQETGNTVTVATASAHTLQVGDTAILSGVGIAAYNGAWTVTAVPTSRSFQVVNPTSGLATSGGGTVTLAAPGASESGNTVTLRTSSAHGRSVGDVVVITGVAGGYNGTFAITATPTARTLQYVAAASGFPDSGGGSVSFFSPFQVRIGGNDSALIGGSGLVYDNTSIQTAINAIPGFAGNVTVSGAASDGFTVTYGGASAGIDVANLQLVNLSCGGCFSSVEETNHGGALDSFHLNYDGKTSGAIINGFNFNASSVQAALAPLLPAGATGTVAGFGGGGFNNTGFQVTYAGALLSTNVPVTLALDVSAGVSAFVGETDKGGPVDNLGGSIAPTGNTIPIVSAPGPFTIPLRTPFSLTGSATDADPGDTLTYSWEQNDRGGTNGISLLNNTKGSGPLFAMFPVSAQVSFADTLKYHSPGENAVTTSPTRIFPDLDQILANNTNADTGLCPEGPIAPAVPVNTNECFAEFLPTSNYVGVANVNASPLSLHFRLTARDGRGGVNGADTTLLLARGTGPFLVTSPNTAVIWPGGSTQTIMWNPAGTNAAPINTASVKITLSTDGGHTFPTVLAASTANDGSEEVTLPKVDTTQARIMVGAVGNVFFDISNSNFTIDVPVVSNNAPAGGALVQYSDSLSPTVTISASDSGVIGSALSATAVGLPGGMSLAIGSTSSGSTLPGTRTWTVSGATTATPGSYPVTVTVLNGAGGSATTSFAIAVGKEDAEPAYAGDMLAFTVSGGSMASVTLRATLRDSSLLPVFGDTEPGDIRNATVTFKEGVTTLCGPTAAALINGATTTGTASCVRTLGLGAHQIDVYVNNYYAGTASGIVEVAQPTGSFITGGGYHAIGSSGGAYQADSGSRLNFGFNIKYTGAGKNAQGHLNVVYRAGGRTYQIKSTASDSLGIALKTSGGGSCAGPPSATCFGLADFRSKANLTDVTDPLNPVALGSGLALQATVTDKGEPGSSDTIGVTLWNGNKLVFSSEWSGAKTVEGAVNAGNLVVH